MPKKISCKPILKLLVAGAGVNEVARSLHVSKHSVITVREAAEKCGIPLEELLKMDTGKLYSLLLPGSQVMESNIYYPDYKYIHEELGKPKVTLKLLHEEYLQFVPSGKIGISYSRFCRGYKEFAQTSAFANHLERKPGRAIEVDWSGPKMVYTNLATGRKVYVSLFVATMPYSQYSYAEATPDMKMRSWISCNIHMLEFFGRLPMIIVCDNLKTGVIKHLPKEEPVLTPEYEAFGEHYGIAIMPARVREPRDKNSVENNVNNLGTDLIARSRNHTFYSLSEIQEYIHKQTDIYNSRPFQKREGSRKEAFEQEEANYMRSLPAVPYRISEWFYGRTVQLNSHVSYHKNYYSVPHRYIRKRCDLKVTDNLLEIYYEEERIASHILFDDSDTNQYSTVKEHMPRDPKEMEMNEKSLLEKARKVGPKATLVIQKVFDDCDIKEQGIRPSLSILGLKDDYGPERLEKACTLALTKTGHPRYHYINEILKHNQDKEIEEMKTKPNPSANTRGSDYYGRKK